MQKNTCIRLFFFFSSGPINLATFFCFSDKIFYFPFRRLVIIFATCEILLLFLVTMARNQLTFRTLKKSKQEILRCNVSHFTNAIL